MRTDSVVYRKLVARIAMLGLSRREVADHLGVTYGTLHNKLCAHTPFTLNEAISLRRLLGLNEPLEELFRRADEKEPS